MEFLFEFIAELLFEGGLEIGSNKKISKWIRYPILVIIIAFFVAIIALLFIVGIALIKRNILAALLFIIVAIIFTIGTIIKFKNIFKNKTKRGN